MCCTEGLFYSLLLQLRFRLVVGLILCSLALVYRRVRPLVSVELLLFYRISRTVSIVGWKTTATLLSY